MDPLAFFLIYGTNLFSSSSSSSSLSLSLSLYFVLHHQQQQQHTHRYDKIKAMFLRASGEENFGIMKRLSCGAGAAVVATSATYPLDMIRLRLSVQPELRGK